MATNNDPRTEAMKRDMDEHFEEFEREYRDGTYGKVVYEDSEVVIVSDESGHELREWADEYDVDSDELSYFFHDVARTRYSPDMTGDPWAVNDPIVFDKFED